MDEVPLLLLLAVAFLNISQSFQNPGVKLFMHLKLFDFSANAF